jgi:hypothetical protein
MDLRELQNGSVRKDTCSVDMAANEALTLWTARMGYILASKNEAAVLVDKSKPQEAPIPHAVDGTWRQDSQKMKKQTSKQTNKNKKTLFGGENVWVINCTQSPNGKINIELMIRLGEGWMTNANVRDGRIQLKCAIIDFQQRQTTSVSNQRSSGYITY